MNVIRNSVLAAVLSLATTTAMPQSQVPGCPTEPVYIPNGFGTGEVLYNLSERDLRAEVRGFVNGLFASAAIGANAKCMEFYDACLRSKTDTQLTAVVRRFLEENPARWNQPAGILMYSAIPGMCH